jgi:hypothetical protein
MLTSLRDVQSYAGPQNMPVGRYVTELDEATSWINARVHGLWPAEHPPAAIREAVALLAAIFICDPLAMRDESRVPNMVRLMLVPYSK